MDTVHVEYGIEKLGRVIHLFRADYLRRDGSEAVGGGGGPLRSNSSM